MIYLYGFKFIQWGTLRDQKDQRDLGLNTFLVKKPANPLAFSVLVNNNPAVISLIWHDAQRGLTAQITGAFTRPVHLIVGRVFI